jgi:hypothetical protein
MRKVLLPLVTLLLVSSVAHAGLKVVGKGDTMHLDPSGFPPAMKANYDILKVKCIKCHNLERTIVAIQTGIAPISGQPFDRNATKAYGVKMLRKADSNMNKQEVKATVELMNWLLDEANK